MNEKFIRQIIAELIDQNALALGVLTQALAQQIDATKLAEDLRRYISAATATGDLNEVGIKIAMTAMAAADAESSLQKQEKH